MFLLGSKCSGKNGTHKNTCKHEPKKLKLQRGMSNLNLAGQFHQPAYVEHLLGLKTKSRLVCRGKFFNKR